MRYIVIDDQSDIVNINTSRNNIRSYQNIDASALELSHNLVALRLFQIRVHFSYIELHSLESLGHFLNLQFGRGENDDSFRCLVFEQGLDNAHFLVLVANVSSLDNLFGRLGYSQLYLYRIGEDVMSQLLDFRRHGSREHDGLAFFRQILHNLHDVIVETHVEHAVGFVQNEERHFRQVYISHAQVADESSRCGDNHIGSQCQTSLFLLETDSVVSSIYRHA